MGRAHEGQQWYWGGPGNERRWLFLHYSIDCLNWFPAGCVARWPDSVHRSFMYPSAVIDGDDLVILSRTSRDAEDQHDADLLHHPPCRQTSAAWQWIFTRAGLCKVEASPP